MNTQGDSVKRSDPIEVGNGEPERLIGLRSAVDHEGEFVSFDLHFTNQHPFKLRIEPAEMASIFSEIRQASTVMLTRQRLHLDHGASRLLEMMEAALRPDTFDAVMDPTNLDRVLIYQFAQHAPIAIRMSAPDIALARTRSDAAAYAILH